MSTFPPGKLPLPELAAMKRRGDRIVMVTAYDAPGARFAEDAGIDIVLVGDTAAMVVLGYEGTTVPVTVDEMLFLTRTVSRQVRRPIVVGDLPFGSYEVSDEDAVRTAIRFVKEGGADVIKLEGAGPMVSRVRRIVESGIPVMAHIGLTPQSATMLGGFKTQG
jgi:3-methyl-2-oxobutanoate hydroxymethyltransferase